MSHFDTIIEAPPGFVVTASSAIHAGAAFEEPDPRVLRRAVPPRGAAHAAGPGAAWSGSCYDAAG